jgi:polysaccharide export outer membrane protein
MVCLTACGASLTPDNPNALSAGPALDTSGTPVADEAKVGATDKAGKATVLAATAPAKPAVALGSGYKIGPQDVLEVSVFKVPELTRTVQVADTGTVNLPLVGEITVAGRSPKDVEQELTKKLGAKYLQSPQVSVSMKEYNSQRVTVDGAVKKPGVIAYRNSLSLLQVIAMADGLDANSDSTVVIFRDEKGERQAARFDIGDIRSGAAKDPAIQPGDTVVVGSSAVKEAFNNVLKALPLAGLFVGL